jgi:hypothetical protein
VKEEVDTDKVGREGQKDTGIVENDCGGCREEGIGGTGEECAFEEEEENIGIEKKGEENAVGEKTADEQEESVLDVSGSVEDVCDIDVEGGGED